MSNLPYPTALDAQSFPWPDEDKIKAESDARADAPYGRQSPYNPGAGAAGGGGEAPPYMPSVAPVYPSLGEYRTSSLRFFHVVFLLLLLCP